MKVSESVKEKVGDEGDGNDDHDDLDSNESNPTTRAKSRDE